MSTKLSIAHKIFVLEKDLILNSSSFQNFFSENEVRHWYTLRCTIFSFVAIVMLKSFCGPLFAPFQLYLSIFNLISTLIFVCIFFVVSSLVQDWLKPYAAFCFLRDFFETSDHSQWGSFSQFSTKKVIIYLVSAF